MRRNEWLSICELKRDIKKQSWKEQGILEPKKVKLILEFVDKTFGVLKKKK